MGVLWTDTQWRQGSLLTDAGAHRLGLVQGPGTGHRAVVVSHDCDLASDKEEAAEVIVGTMIDKPSKPYMYAKNPRQLHVGFSAHDDEMRYVDLRHTDRRQVSKSLLSDADLDLRFVMPEQEQRALRQWLAARYGRPAFPNAFEARLRKQVGRKSVAQRIVDTVETDSSHVLGLFFELEETRDVELPEGQAYTLSISIIYDGEAGGPQSEEAANTAAHELRTLFENAYGPANEATEIALKGCDAIRHRDVTLAYLRKADQWRLEHISLRDEPAGDFLPAGEVPV